MPYPDLAAYEIHDPSDIYSPALLIYRDLLTANLQEMINIAGAPSRLRPHCKTHKSREIIAMQLELGITRHKCATLAEAEMLAEAGVTDILLAYQLVGPNIARWLKLVERFPHTKFASLVDHPAPLEALDQARLHSLTAAGRESDRAGEASRLQVLLDLNPGMNRTGIAVGPQAIELYEAIVAAEAVSPGGLHWYDGHHRQTDLQQRTVAVESDWNRCVSFRDQLLLSGLPVPKIVAGGTGSFPILAEQAEPQLELSPGTTTFYDDDMVTRFPETNFQPALAILTRVISHNVPGHLTLDVGHKACAADQPAGARLAFPQLPDAEEVLHSEEHLVIKTAAAKQFQLGDHLIAIPRHACPVSAVHSHAHVIGDGQLTDRWLIAARDR